MTKRRYLKTQKEDSRTKSSEERIRNVNTVIDNLSDEYIHIDTEYTSDDDSDDQSDSEEDSSSDGDSLYDAQSEEEEEDANDDNEEKQKDDEKQTEEKEQKVEGMRKRRMFPVMMIHL
eukprot:1150843_1